MVSERICGQIIRKLDIKSNNHEMFVEKNVLD